MGGNRNASAKWRKKAEMVYKEEHIGKAEYMERNKIGKDIHRPLLFEEQNNNNKKVDL